MLTSEWSRVQEVFLAVADLRPAERGSAVEQHCGADTALAREVLSLLAEDAETRQLFPADLPTLAASALAERSLHALVAQQIGPYRLLRVLGEGGMGVVFLAERMDIGGKVAIKLLRHPWMSPTRRERFTQEQSLLARLNHPHIARIYDASTLPDGTPWFVMEYVSGLPFSGWIAATPGDLPTDLRVFLQVCEAVRYAHGHAIIHRDLKPSNILVSEDGGVKLLDFGIAKHLAAASDACLTGDGMQLMTPAYAAPEQVIGQPTGSFTDVYALGVLLHEMLAGTLPVAAKDRRPETPLARPSIQANATGGAAAARYQLSRQQWSDLDALCLTALHLEPARRYLSADALVSDVQAFLDGRPLVAHAPGVLYDAGKFLRRNGAALASLATGILLLCGLALSFTVRLAQAKNAALAEVARTERLQLFTRSLFDGGDAEAGRSQNLTTAVLLQRGEVEAESLGNDVRLQADMLSTLGTAYRGLGQLEHADILLVQALRRREQSPGKQDRQYVESLVALGLLRKDQARLQDAESLLQQAVTLDRAHKDTGHLGRSLWALGSVLTLHGRYDESRPLLEEAVRVNQRAGADRAQYADDLSALADVHVYLDDLPAAAALDGQALTVYQQEYGDRHPAVADVLDTLGQIALNQGHYPAAESYFRRSLAIVESWYGSDHTKVADGLTSLARVLASEHHVDEAAALLTGALAIQTRIYGHQHARVALVLNQRGTLAFDRDDYVAAERDMREALAIWRAVYGEKHQFVGLCYANLAGVMMQRRQYPMAEKMIRKALAVYDVTLPADHVNFAIAHVKLGRILLRQGHYREAETESLEGYRYFSRHESNYDSYLRGARKDLAEIEAHLQKPETLAQMPDTGRAH